MTPADDNDRDECCRKGHCPCPTDDACNDKDWDAEWAANPGKQRA